LVLFSLICKKKFQDVRKEALVSRFNLSFAMVGKQAASDNQGSD
jgi:hypothetical protein